ncbi:hydrogenase expression/formation protein [Candidatus Entotheonella serta]|nr:hydrogenase expression/formation protein [Candidatus Entotheonella serta]
MNPLHLSPGKLPPALLERVLRQIPQHDDRLLIGPSVGEDAAIIDMGDRLLVAKADPITFATDAIGYYAVNVNANDIAAMGGTPRWFLASLLLPETQTTEGLVETIFNQLRDACDALNITLAGGHTEITVDLNRPILSGHMLGEVSRDRLVTSAGAQVGDTILLTKGFPVEGISIIARECAAQLQAHGMSQADIDTWQHYLFSPGISVVRDAQVLQDTVDVHAMHDPTEGGVATGLHELAHASGVGIHIDADHLPLLDAGAQLCAQFGLDPLGTIASGALLAIVPAAQTERAIAACRAADIPCYAIGTVVEASSGRQLHRASGTQSLPTFASDEIVKIFI